jgi:DGQHR domain-containing protein
MVRISPTAKFKPRRVEGEKYGFLVWNFMALQYYRRISSTLGAWTKYELFKDFSISHEAASTFALPALQLKQKGHTMYLASIHPGLLLKIGYVVRRATEKTYAYQRMLSKDRIKAIGEFISDPDTRNFIPNSVLAVFDSDSQTQKAVKYDAAAKTLTIPVKYCCAWIIDGQHRAFGFLGTQYEDWTPDKFEPFLLPIVLFKSLEEVVQTETFININYNQKRIKSDLLCDLFTLTKDLQHRLTWASLLGRELNDRAASPLRDKVRISELHGGRPISLASLVQYGLLEGLLGYKQKAGYTGYLYTLAPFNRSEAFDTPKNQAAFTEQADLLVRFLIAVEKNTQTPVEASNPWKNTSEFALLRPTGINACFLLLARILELHPGAGLDLSSYLKPLASVNFKKDPVAKMGGGWKGFRGLANAMIRKINKGKSKSKRLRLYGQKEKM